MTPPAPPTPSETASAAAANDDAADAPDGSGAITLWAGYGFNGANKTLTGDAPDLAALGWTDLASSLQVRGVWEVCEKPNYAGNCARIEDDQPNLADIGFNHRIRSLRRAEAKP